MCVIDSKTTKDSNKEAVSKSALQLRRTEYNKNTPETVIYLIDQFVSQFVWKSRDSVSRGWHNYSQTLRLTTHPFQNKYFYRTIHGGGNQLEISKHGQNSNKEKTDKLWRKTILLIFLMITGKAIKKS